MERLVFPQLGGCGRLGNQLWQVAATIGLAATHGLKPCLPPAWDYRPYFSVPDEFFDQLGGKHATQFVPYMPSSARDYLQDFSLFSAIEDDIRQWFQPSVLAKELMVERHGYYDLDDLPRPIASVHVRRGDNAVDPGTPDKHLWHPMPTDEWYQRAYQALPDCPTVFVFSDDIAWCKERLPRLLGRDDLQFFTGVARPKEHEAAYMTAPVLDWIDLFVMAQCDFHSISNSTYSWWGAFLSWDPSPVYPWPWFGPNLAEIDASLMFPPSWTAVPREVLRAAVS